MPTGIYKRTKYHRKIISESRKGKHHSEETKRKISEALKERHCSDEMREKMSTLRMGKSWGNHTEETKKKISKARKGKKLSRATKRKLSESKKGKSYEEVFGKERALIFRERCRKNAKKRWQNPRLRKKIVEALNRPEVKKKCSKASLKNWQDPEFKKKRSEAAKKQWQDPELRKKWLECINFKPSALEKCFDDITPDIVRYIGNGAWWRTLPNGKYKNPDFKVTGQNKVIEIFGDYWHKNDNPQELIDLYAKAGLDCVIFWESEIYKNPQEVLNRAMDFINK